MVRSSLLLLATAVAPCAGFVGTPQRAALRPATTTRGARRAALWSAVVDVEPEAEAATATAASAAVDVEASTMFISAPTTPFAIGEAVLVVKAKQFLLSRSGLGADPDLLAESFQFEGPVVGPLGKDAFVKAIGSVDMSVAFPDFVPEFYGFNVDPLEPNRVWYIARGRGTNTGPFLGGMPATGKAFVNPPQACSLTFDADGLVTKYTIGYVIDRTVGNTGGLGGIYGILYAIGRPLPFPEANPWRKSLPYWAFQEAGGLLAKLGGLGGGGK